MEEVNNFQAESLLSYLFPILEISKLADNNAITVFVWIQFLISGFPERSITMVPTIY
jgi:hypothetical protein